MNKKPKQSQRKGWLVSPQQIAGWLDKASAQMVEADYNGVLQTCQRVLRYALAKSQERAEALQYLGLAHSMLQNYSEAYAAMSAALELSPSDPGLWFNRGMASRYTMRLGQSQRDFERAVELGKKHELKDKFAEALKFSRQLAQSSLQLRGPGFTLEQLIEQEELFQQGLTLMTAKKWPEAEAAFRRVIEMGDCLPQPWGNLGGCLVMQQRYDEAEAAWKRALEIDPKYEHARLNLTILPETRRRGGPQDILLTEPFAGREVKKTITFLKS
jgi:superkiller protein 3